MFCKQCGAEIKDGAKFCSKCGATAVQIQGLPEKEKSGKKKLLIGAALGVLAVSGISIMLVVYFTSSGYRGRKCVKEAEKYMQEEAFQEAITSYKEALEYLPEDVAAREGLEEAYLEMAQDLYQRKKYDEAMEVYETLKKLNPERHEIYLGESDIYLQSDDVIVALDVLETGKTFADVNVLSVREEYIKEHTTAYLTHKYLEWVEYEYEYDEAGNLAKEISCGSDGSVGQWFEYEYDTYGNRINEIEYERTGVVCWRRETKYDAVGNQIKVTEYDGDGSISQCFEYEYDVAGNKTKSVSYGSMVGVSWWNETEYEYDAAGNQIKSIRYNSTGKIIEWYEYEYDAVGNQIKEIYYDGDGSVGWWTEYGYDAVGKQIKEIEYYSDGTYWGYEIKYDADSNQTKAIHYEGDGTVWWEVYEYDGSGNQIKEIYYDSDGSIIWWIEYEYDAVGNQIKSINYNGDGSVGRWTEYEFSVSGIEMTDTGNFSHLNKGIDSYCIKITDCDENGNAKEVSLECDIVYHFSE